MDDNGAPEGVEPLSRREQLVLGWIARGLTDREIADRLRLSLNTVKWYARRVYAKLHVSHRTQAVIVARSLGLTGPGLDADRIRGSPLPLPATPLLGRGRELEAVNRLLDDEAIRLVTLLGPGGIGKSRLALAVAADRQQRVGEAVYFVPLQAVPSGKHLIRAVADAIGFQFGGAQEPDSQLLRGLSGMQALLVLDNFEHLVETSLFVAEMLGASPGLTLLTTSRERLNLQGETVFTLGGLAYSAEWQPADDFSAAQLFVQTARRTRPGFAPDGNARAHILDICKMVEGMPLAIELAAGWMDLLTPDEVARELEKGLGLLSTPLRDVPDRHRSMQAVFEHSWRLLTPQEQAIFKKLSVFRGGFDRRAAEAVAGATLPILAVLADKSLVARVGEDRYRLHELLRQFAEDRLRADPAEYDHTLDHHCHHYGTLLGEYENNFKKSAALIVADLTRLSADYDNILVGWHRAIEQPLLADFRPYSLGMSMLLARYGQFSTGVDTLRQAQQHMKVHYDQVSAGDRLRVLTLCGLFLDTVSDFEQSQGLFQEALLLSERQPEVLETDPDIVGLLLNFASWNAIFTHDMPRARALLERSLALNQEMGFEFGFWQAKTVQGELELVAGDVEAAVTAHTQSLEYARRTGDISAIVCSLALVACDCTLLGDVMQACDFMRQTLDMSRQFLIADAVCAAIVSFALLHGEHGRPETTLDMLAILLHHPQCGNLSRVQIEVLLPRYRALLPPVTVETALEKASKGQLSTPLLKPDFVVDAAFVDRLQTALDESGWG